MAKRLWSQSSYGKTALSAKFSVEGVNELLEKIAKTGKNVDAACHKAVAATLPIIEKSMRDGANRHRRTGEVVEAIELQDVKQQGNYIYGVVGINLEKHPEAIEGVFQEYGDGHSPEFPDPFVRPAVDDNKRRINSTIKKVLQKEGVPVE